VDGIDFGGEKEKVWVRLDDDIETTSDLRASRGSQSICPESHRGKRDYPVARS